MFVAVTWLLDRVKFNFFFARMTVTMMDASYAEAEQRVWNWIAAGNPKAILTFTGIGKHPTVSLHGNLTRFPPLPEGLRILECNYQNISEILDLPSSLVELHLYGNRSLKSICSLPPKLTVLDVHNSWVGTLPKLPPKLRKLICNGCSLTELPELPPRLTELNCACNQITRLPTLSKHLTKLICFQNNLTELTGLPEKITMVSASMNQIHQIDRLPDALKELYISNNKVTELPALPSQLQALHLRYNPITTYPEVSPSMKPKLCDFLAAT